MIIHDDLLKIELFSNKLIDYIYITGDELIKRIAAIGKSSNNQHTLPGDKLIFFQLPELFDKPITVESIFMYNDYLSLITNIGPGGLFRIKLYTSSSSKGIAELISWKPSQWDEDNLIQNLEALKLFRTELTLKSMWNVIYDNPGKDWNKTYLTLFR